LGYAAANGTRLTNTLGEQNAFIFRISVQEHLPVNTV